MRHVTPSLRLAQTLATYENFQKLKPMEMSMKKMMMPILIRRKAIFFCQTNLLNNIALAIARKTFVENKLLRNILISCE